MAKMDKKGLVREGPAAKGKAPGVMAGDSSLAGAVKELMTQHPQKYDDLGPHRETDDHIRHEALHGLKPC